MTSSDCGVCGNVNGDSTDDFEKGDIDGTDAGRWRVCMGTRLYI